MLKKSASFVLAVLGGSTYRTEYASPPRLLRPRWTAFLTILRAADAVPDLLECCVAPVPKVFFNNLLE
ncbi:MAG: hypothetical protein IH977_06005 [Nitrospinae bacterium]|nr:hypothetical protein [Nitrospinota bacterium]